MPEEKRVSPALLIIPVGLGLGLAVALGVAAMAAPPVVYTCPVCGAEFATEEELLAHIELEHPEMLAEFAYVSAIRQIPYIQDPGTPWAREYLAIEIDVQNVGDIAGACIAKAQARAWDTDPESPYYDDWGPWVDFPNLEVWKATLQPQQVVTFSAYQVRSSAYGYNCQVRFIGDAGEIMAAMI